MIISRTPYRLSFFGGGTDFPAWYHEHGGAVLATTFNKYCYISVRHLPPFFEHRFRVVYSVTETCQAAEQIRHPAVRGALQHLGIETGLEIHHDGDLPARSGLGSSSSFVVGLLHALRSLQGVMSSKRDLAAGAIHVEQKILKENVGDQDQVMAAHGGLNLLRFDRNGEVTVRPLTLPAQRVLELNSHLMLFFTGVARTSTDIAGRYAHDLKSKTAQLSAYGPMVEEAQRILLSKDSLDEFGTMMHEAWMLKRSINDCISTSAIDEIYEAARDAGALGGKIIGAGGGGFLLLFARPEVQPQIRSRLKGLLEVPFEFEHHGSQIIFYDPES
jgi:D-glycero-alpha-D-manno-heptose-7-phosphate kinase